MLTEKQIGMCMIAAMREAVKSQEDSEQYMYFMGMLVGFITALEKDAGIIVRDNWAELVAKLLKEMKIIGEV